MLPYVSSSYILLTALNLETDYLVCLFLYFSRFIQIIIVSSWTDTSGCLLFRKVWWAIRIGSFCQKLGYFTDQNKPKRDHRKMNSDTKMNVANSAKGKWETWGHLRSFHVSFLGYFPETKKCILANFVLDSGRNVSLLQQFTCMRLKVLITFFQKMMWVVDVWTTINEMLAIKISKKMLIQQKFNKIPQESKS